VTVITVSINSPYVTLTRCLGVMEFRGGEVNRAVPQPDSRYLDETPPAFEPSR
jgi:hypothetical protein